MFAQPWSWWQPPQSPAQQGSTCLQGARPALCPAGRSSALLSCLQPFSHDNRRAVGIQVIPEAGKSGRLRRKDGLSKNVVQTCTCIEWGGLEEEPFGLPCFTEKDKKKFSSSKSLSFPRFAANNALLMLSSPKALGIAVWEGNCSVPCATAVPRTILTLKSNPCPSPTAAQVQETHHSGFERHLFWETPGKAPQSGSGGHGHRLTSHPALLHPGSQGRSRGCGGVSQPCDHEERVLCSNSQQNSPLVTALPCFSLSHSCPLTLAKPGYFPFLFLFSFFEKLHWERMGNMFSCARDEEAEVLSEERSVSEHRLSACETRLPCHGAPTINERESVEFQKMTLHLMEGSRVLRAQGRGQVMPEAEAVKK